MAEQTIGFSFQTDVVNTASLAYMLTGRVLKAMSDGGVDLYAVAAAIWLGKQIPISSALESSVHQEIAARQQQVGFLAKALSVGWGHSLIPCEMSRTKAGTSALVLIGALTTGSSYFTAAQIMSELLTASGCEADKVPNVDVLKVLAAYLSPFMQDLGFPKVFQHITTTCVHKLVRKELVVPDSLSSTGDATLIAGIIRQLCLTSESQQAIQMMPRQRTAWVAAFASHVLGMSVIISMGDDTLWACAGANGTVTLHLTADNVNSIVPKNRLDHGFVLIDLPKSRGCTNTLSLDYAPANALTAEVDGDNHLRGYLFPIQMAIARMCFSIVNTERVGTLVYLAGSLNSTSRKLYGNFPGNAPIRDALAAFGIPDSIISLAELRQVSFSVWLADQLAAVGLRFLNPDVRIQMCAECPKWTAEPPDDNTVFKRIDCNCIETGRLITAFARSIVALAQCSCDLRHLRLNADYLRGSKTTVWMKQDLEIGGMDYRASIAGIFEHIAHLLFPSDVSRTRSLYDANDFAASTLGLSGGAYTIYYAAIKDHMAYQNDGRVLTIASGRASLGGVLKNSIIQYYNRADGGPEPITTMADLADLSRGSFLEPQYHPGKSQVFVDASLTEHDISMDISVGTSPLTAKRVELRYCIESLLIRAVVPECEHNIEEPWKVPGNRFGRVSYRLAPFGQMKNFVDGTLIYALKGDRLQQVIQFGLLNEASLVLQLRCCLKCANAAADGQRLFVMGG